MKTKILLGLAATFALSLEAQVRVLPPDFTLFGKTSREYLVEYLQATEPLSTNGDYLLPKVIPSLTDPVYFLQRPHFGVAPPNGIQTYFVPDNVYVFVSIFTYSFDNIGNVPPWTLEELRDALRAALDDVSELHAIIDGMTVTNLFAHRIESPIFSIYYPNSDNIITVLLQQPYEGLDEPVVAGGFPMMLAPLPVGLHDFQTGAMVGGPLGLSYARHYQIQVYPANHPPVADVTATLVRVISPNSHNARVVLDGSRSSDPDNDPLTFSWLEAGSMIGAAVLSTNLLAVGAHDISLVVSDGKLSATNGITVEVVTPCEAVGELADLVEAAHLARKQARPLLEELQEACAAFELGFRARHHDREEPLKHAIHELTEFQHEVKEQLGRRNPALAALLIGGAQEIIDAVSKPPTHHLVKGNEDEHNSE